jgi:hypothetical protein
MWAIQASTTGACTFILFFRLPRLLLAPRLPSSLPFVWGLLAAIPSLLSFSRLPSSTSSSSCRRTVVFSPGVGALLSALGPTCRLHVPLRVAEVAYLLNHALPSVSSLIGCSLYHTLHVHNLSPIHAHGLEMLGNPVSVALKVVSLSFVAISHGMVALIKGRLHRSKPYQQGCQLLPNRNPHQLRVGVRFHLEEGCSCSRQDVPVLEPVDETTLKL